jgi:hypothetical protein
MPSQNRQHRSRIEPLCPVHKQHAGVVSMIFHFPLTRLSRDLSTPLPCARPLILNTMQKIKAPIAYVRIRVRFISLLFVYYSLFTFREPFTGYPSIVHRACHWRYHQARHNRLDDESPSNSNARKYESLLCQARCLTSLYRYVFSPRFLLSQPGTLSHPGWISCLIPPT